MNEPLKLSSPTVKILVAALRVWERDGRLTVRSVAKEADRSIARTHMALRQLRKAGLVAWEEGRVGTLRLLVRRA